MKPNIWIIDDEPGICVALKLALEIEYQVTTFSSGAAALRRIDNENCDIILLDLKLKDEDGIEVLKKIKQKDPDITVVMMTAFGSISSSVDAVKAGAYSYLTKPLDLDQLRLLLRQILEMRKMSEQIDFLSGELNNHRNSRCIIGESSAMNLVYSRIDQVKDVDASVLITGESGTGKELVARAIHEDGARKKERFIIVNCAAIPENLLEPEFFGYKKGAFTGALQDHKGKLEMADKGTIFLDEIGDMPLSLQAKLLRALQEKEFTPVGSTELHHVDVRVISATNQDLKKLVTEGKFREDLYYRLNVVNISVPPLRDRQEDIPLLCRHFLERYSKEMNKPLRTLTDEALEALMHYSYPGNVRQLANFMEYASIVCTGKNIGIGDLPEDLSGPAAGGKRQEKMVDEYLSVHNLKEIERQAIIATLEKNKGRRNRTAEDLGLSIHGLMNKIKEYGIEK